jgi:hypothetical protein
VSPALVALETRELLSITISIDYSFDTDSFFNTQAKRDLMQQAASVFSGVLNDSLTPITPGGIDTWTASFIDPATGSTRSVPNLNVPANTLIVYVGGGHLGGLTEAGRGGPGGYSASGDINWLNVVKARGKAGALSTPATAFAPWGGSVTFDDSGFTNWYFGSSIAGLNSTQTDFLSVAEHEFGHLLGLGTSDPWHADVTGGLFVGVNAEAAYGGKAVPVNATGDHWAPGVQSGSGPALMDPVLLNGTRVVATSLDFAALKDIGWQVQAAQPMVQFSAAAFIAGDNAGSAVISVSRTGGTGAFSVGYATANGTARAGVDYQSTSGVLNFGPTDTVKTFTIPLLGDPAPDGTETVNLRLSSPTGGAALGAASTAVLSLSDGMYHPLDNFDGDGRTDQGVFRPSTATWFVLRSSAGFITPFPTFGATNLFDIPIVGDFDGVGHAEIGVFRPSTSQWIVLGASGSHVVGTFGAPNLVDIPVPGDYDGVGHTEMAVFRPSTSQWIVRGPSGDHVLGSFGAPNLFDIPVPGDYDGIGRTEMAVFRPSTAQWFVHGPSGGRLMGSFGAASLFDIPAPGDYDGVGHTEMAVFRLSTAQWFALGPAAGHSLVSLGGPNGLDLPIESSVASLMKLGIVGSAPRRFGAAGGSSGISALSLAPRSAIQYGARVPQVSPLLTRRPRAQLVALLGASSTRSLRALQSSGWDGGVKHFWSQDDHRIER